MDEQENPHSEILQPDPLTIGELISLAEAAKLSGFSHSLLKQMAEQGRLPAKKIARNWLTTLASVEEYKKTRSYVRKKE
jgi:hypothetical protein